MHLFPIVEEVFTDLEKITQADVDRAERLLTKISRGERLLGDVSATTTKRIWALRSQYQANAEQLDTKAKYEANSAEETKALQLQVSRYLTLASLCKDIFFAQAEDDCGMEAHNVDHVALRKGWCVVEAKDPGERIARQMLGGLMRIDPPADERD